MIVRPITCSLRKTLPLICTAAALLVGCAHDSGGSHPLPPTKYYETIGLTRPHPVPVVDAQCDPPVGWIPQPLHKSERHTHQIWLSPSGKTAYGVLHFKLPFPVGVGIVHWEFLREMKLRYGDANELSQKYDPSLPGLRFVCESDQYLMRVNMTVHGFDGWAAYAGTLRGQTPVPEELHLAETARENTIFGLPENEKNAADRENLSDSRLLNE
jgi:hypothetical protein